MSTAWRLRVDGLVDHAAVWLIDRRRFLLARTLWRLSGLI
ncbi:hypothetical protein M2157_005602 [Streptomyces sp. SAI-127]|nr:hypothetical protein [Streptomyces sp. SAI-127]